MSWYLLVRFLHIGSAIVFIGGILARQLVRSFAGKTEDIHRFAAYNEAAGIIEKFMVIPGNFAVIFFGVILAWILKAPILGFLQGASQNWLLVTNILLILGFFNVPFVFIPRGKKFNFALEDALAKGQVTPQLRTELADPVVRAVHLIEIASVLVIVYLMVFRPF